MTFPPPRPAAPGQPMPAAAPPPAAAAPPPPGAAPPGAPPASAGGSGGPQKVSNLEFNQQIQNILLSRIEQAGTQNPNWGRAIDACMTPQAAQDLVVILPELEQAMVSLGWINGGAPGIGAPGAGAAPPGAGGPAGMPQPPMPGAGAGAPPPAPGGLPRPPSGAPVAQAGGDDEGGGADEEDDDEENPLVRSASPGLMG